MNTLIFERTVEKLYYVFQPIVSIHTGTTFGFEALLRGYEETGFSSIFNLFDAFFEEKVLYKIDLILREKAVTQFMSLGHIKSTRLFLQYR